MPPKPMVLESFPRAGCGLCRRLSAARIGMCKIAPCFRIVSASDSATRSALVLAVQTGLPSASTVRGDVGIAPYGDLSVKGA